MCLPWKGNIIVFTTVLKFLVIIIDTSKVGDLSRGWLEGALFTSYYSKGKRYSIRWIAPLYSWSLPYNAEYLARRHKVPFFKSLVWLDLGLNLGLPDHCWTFYSLGQWPSYFIIDIMCWFMIITWMDTDHKFIFQFSFYKCGFHLSHIVRSEVPVV